MLWLNDKDKNIIVKYYNMMWNQNPVIMKFFPFLL